MLENAPTRKGKADNPQEAVACLYQALTWRTKHSCSSHLLTSNHWRINN